MDVVGVVTSVQVLCAATCLCLRPSSYRRTGRRRTAAPDAPEPDSSSSGAICPPLLVGGADLLTPESVLEAPRVLDPEGTGREMVRRRRKV